MNNAELETRLRQTENELAEMKKKRAEAEKRIFALEKGFNVLLQAIKALRAQNRGYKGGVDIEELLIEPVEPQLGDCVKCCNNRHVRNPDGSWRKCECQIKYDEEKAVYKEKYALWVKKKATEVRRKKRDEKEIQKDEKAKTGFEFLDS
jgi:hypothetical protein